MRVMVMVKATVESERGDPPEAAMFEAMGRFNAELVAAGIMPEDGGDGLKPSSHGTRVAFDGPNRAVIDGPFAHTGELVAGFWLWTVKDMDEAIGWVKRCPNPMPGPSEIEIRPLYEMSDFEGSELYAMPPDQKEPDVSTGTSAAASDPMTLGVMTGFPPPDERLVRLHDGSSWAFPGTRWSFSHQRELTPSVNIPRGGAPARDLPAAPRDDLDAVGFTTQDGRPMTWAESLDETCADGVVVLHRGAAVYERYFGALEPHLPHLAMSVTKSFVGLLAAMLAHEGRLDPNQPVGDRIPELKAGAYGDATIRQVMDMTVGVQYSETYIDPTAEIWAYTAASGISPRRPDYAGPESIFDFLRGLKKSGEHGEAFAYKTCNTEVLGWIVQRITDTPLATLLSERIWRLLGAEEDAYLLVDRIGAALCGAGLNLTLRDLARFGEMMRLGGAVDGRRIVPAEVVADIAAGADRSDFAKAGYVTLPGWSYGAQWWVSHDRFGAYSARGIHGQALWIAPGAELVIARFASHPTAANGNGPLDRVSLPAYRAMAEHLLRS